MWQCDFAKLKPHTLINHQTQSHNVCSYMVYGCVLNNKYIKCINKDELYARSSYYINCFIFWTYVINNQSLRYSAVLGKWVILIFCSPSKCVQWTCLGLLCFLNSLLCFWAMIQNGLLCCNYPPLCPVVYTELCSINCYYLSLKIDLFL